MQRFGMRAFALLFYLALDALLVWVLLSAAISFIDLELVAIHSTGLGRAAWLFFTAIDAKGSIAKAIAIADRQYLKPGRA